MSTDLYARAKQVFVDAMERPKHDRSGFVESACGQDEALKKEVLSWIEASDRAGSNFLGESAAKMCLTCDGTFLFETKFCPHCGQPLHDDPRALVGTRLDNLYQIDALLGRGGMGAVYRARHSLLGDLVAIKTLKKELSDDPKFLKRFQREGQAARSFRHPNAVTVHDLRTTPAGLIYMVLEYIDGVTLREHVRKHKRLSVSEVIELLTPIAGALDAAHRHGVVHRDMKPENVMVSTDESGDLHVKVLDLGIATMRYESDSLPTTALTAIGTVLGTPQYMSPEQWGTTPRDGLSQIDGRADVYSLGVMAFEMMTGEWPYTAKSIEDFRLAHCTHRVPSAHDRCAGVSSETSEVLAVALAKDRADRWPSPGAFVAALASSATSDSPVTEATRQLATRSTIGDESSNDGTFDQTIAGVGERPSALDSGETLVRAAAPSAHVNGTAHRRSPLPVMGLVLAVIAVGVFVLWAAGLPPFRARSNPSIPTAEVAPVGPVAPGALPTVFRFGLDVKRKGEALTERTSGSEPLGRIEGFRLVLQPSAPGRIAIIGPNRGNVPTLYLPVDRSAGTSPGSEIVFPDGRWFGLTGDTPSDTLSVVFIPDGAQVPAFAAGTAGRQLLPEEQRELAALRTAQPLAPRYEAREGLFAASLDGRPVVADIVVRY